MPGAAATIASQKPLGIECYAISSEVAALPASKASLGSTVTAALISPRRFALVFC